MRAILLPVLLSLALPAIVRAEEVTVPLAASGDWVALAHRPSSMLPPDVCMVMNSRAGLGIRAGEGAIEVRVFNPRWSLPSHVEGNVTLATDKLSETYPVTSNTVSMLGADLMLEQATALLAELVRAKSITVTVGKDKPVVASLAGSTRAIQAFRTCAGMRGEAGSEPGSNPFK